MMNNYEQGLVINIKMLNFIKLFNKFECTDWEFLQPLYDIDMDYFAQLHFVQHTK